MRGNRTAFWHNILAIFLGQLPAHIRVQGSVERANLLPQPVDLAGKLRRRHVVSRPPHCTGIREAHLSCALVGQFHEARVARGHRPGHCMPAIPKIQHLLRVARIRQYANDVHIGVAFAGLIRRAIFPASIRALQPSSDFREFGAFRGICRRGRGKRKLQQVELTLQFGRQLQLLIASRFAG